MAAAEAPSATPGKSGRMTLRALNPAEDLDLYHNLLIIGKSGGGKTTMLSKMLLDMTKAGRIYGVSVFCGNKDVMDDWQHMVHPSCVFDGFDQAAIKRIMNMAEKLKGLAKQNVLPPRPLLVILDDIGARDRRDVNCPLMKEVITQGRHRGICLWVLAQGWQQINNDTRSQYSDLLLCQENSKGVLKSLLEKFPIGLELPDFIKTMKKATQNRGALVVQMRKASGASPLESLRTYRVCKSDYEAMRPGGGGKYEFFRAGDPALWVQLYKHQRVEDDIDILRELQADLDGVHKQIEAAQAGYQGAVAGQAEDAVFDFDQLEIEFPPEAAAGAGGDDYSAPVMTIPQYDTTA